VIGKFKMLAEPLLGRERSQKVIRDVLALEGIADVRVMLLSLTS
jgi:hypothetical protein